MSIFTELIKGATAKEDEPPAQQPIAPVAPAEQVELSANMQAKTSSAGRIVAGSSYSPEQAKAKAEKQLAPPPKQPSPQQAQKRP